MGVLMITWLCRTLCREDDVRAAKVEVVSEVLRHTLVAITTDIYAHVLPERQREVVNKMDDLFKPFSATS